MVRPPLAPMYWTYHRFINSAHPTIDLFEDIADPADWALLAAAEQKTNPRLEETIGNLDLVPLARRVSGPGSSYVMAPFTHVSLDSPGRFHDGSFGAFYGADSYETAMFETIFHTELFYAKTHEEPGWIADKCELIGDIDTELDDIRSGGFGALLDPSDYTASQAFARDAKADNSDGVVYPSVRNAGGNCFAAFYPDVMDVPVQGRHISYHWDGGRIDTIKDLSDGNKVYEITP